MIAIVDYDAGNIMSVQKACAYLGYQTILTRDRAEILQADHVILPGVGAFADAMKKLVDFGLDETLRETVKRGIPLLGICLGLQLLFGRSDESLALQDGADVRGLCLLDGEILKIDDKNGLLKVPHMGWNQLSFPRESRLYQGIPDGTEIYFVHSYYLKAGNPSIVTATCEYGTQIDVGVERDNLFACQFHPEKSGKWGLRILENFLNI